MIAWNCRGASSRMFAQHLKELIHVNKSDILILIETHCSSTIVENIYRYTYFNYGIISEACGFVGGIWILSNNVSVQLESLSDKGDVLHGCC